MMEIRKVLAGAFSMFVLFSIISCHSTLKPGYTARVHLIPGDKFSYSIVNKLQSTAELGGEKHESGRKVELGLIYEVLRDISDSIVIKVTYDKLHVVMKNDGMDKDIVAKPSGEASDPIDRFFGSLLGSNIMVYINHKGDVLQVTGYNDISEKILASLNLRDGNISNNICQQMSKMIGGEFVKNVFQQGFKIFPDKAIAIDESWTRQENPSEEVKVGVDFADMNTTLTLSSFENNRARVDIKSMLRDITDGDSISVFGYQAVASLDGGQKGHLDIDTVTGMLMDGESTLSLEGKIQMMGSEIPVKITSEKKIEGKKIH